MTSFCENVPGQCVALTFGNGRTKVELEVGWTCCLSGRIDTYSLSSALYKGHILHHISESTQIYATRRLKNEDKSEINCSKWHFYTFMILLQYFLFAKSFFEMIASKTRDKSVMVMQFALTPRLAVCRPLGVPSFYTCISACPFLWGTLWSCCVCSCSRHGFCSLGLEVPPRWQNHGGSLEALVPVSLSLLF